MARRKRRSKPATVIPVFKRTRRKNGRRRTNLEGFMDVHGKFGPKGRFHPMRFKPGYDPEEEGDRTRDWTKWERTARRHGGGGGSSRRTKRTTKRKAHRRKKR